VAEPSGSPPGLTNRNRKQSLTLAPKCIPNPYTNRNPLLRYGDSSIFFKMAAAAISDLENVEILGVGRSKRIK